MPKMLFWNLHIVHGSHYACIVAMYPLPVEKFCYMLTVLLELLGCAHET